MINFPLDYFIYVFVSSIAVIQLAAIKSGLNRLLIIKNKFVTKLCAFILIPTSAIIFIYSENRIINDYEGGLDANEQFLIFSFACVATFIITCLLTSLYSKSEIDISDLKGINGIDALSNYSFINLQILKWKHSKKLI